METHNEMEHILNTLEQNLSIINFTVELSLYSIMNEDACLDISDAILIVPASLEGHWHAVPAVVVDVAKSVSAHLDNALGQDMRL